MESFADLCMVDADGINLYLHNENYIDGTDVARAIAARIHAEYEEARERLHAITTRTGPHSIMSIDLTRCQTLRPLIIDPPVPADDGISE